jgi:hypothetical protein
VKNAVFWLNAFPTDDGVSKKYSPRYIMTGQHLSYDKHAVIEFGLYVQTHEEHSNNMDQRTMGCICLGPTGNQQGGHWFMSLASGERVSRYQWTELPIPREAINCVSMIGRRQGMLDMITYANRQGREIGDTVEDYSSDDDDDDSSYQNSEQSDEEPDEEYSSCNESSSSSDSDSSSSSDGDDDPGNDEGPEIEIEDESKDVNQVALRQPQMQAPIQPMVNDAEIINQPAENQGVGEEPEDDRVKEGDNPGVNSNAGAENPGEDNPGVTAPMADETQEGASSDNKGVPNDRPEQITEHERFELAKAQGHARAQMHNNNRPRRTIKHKQDKDFIYAMLRMMIASHPASNSELGLSADALAFVTAQMLAKAGLKCFGSRGSDAIIKELRQLILLNVMTGCLPSDLTAAQKAKSLRYLMFLKEKSDVAKSRAEVLQTDESREFIRQRSKPARQL